MGIADTLNVRISDVLSSQETEFLRAWRARMYDVQREVAALRASASNAAAALARDEKLKALEASRDWFRAESLRLDALTTRQESEIATLRDRVKALTEDSTWFEERTKESVRKEQRLLARAEAAEAALAAAGADTSARPPPSPARAHFGTATLAALSPARREALLASRSTENRGATASAVAATSVRSAAVGADAARPRSAAASDSRPRSAVPSGETAALKAEVESLRAELEATRSKLVLVTEGVFVGDATLQESGVVGAAEVAQTSQTHASGPPPSPLRPTSSPRATLLAGLKTSKFPGTPGGGVRS